jgi:hypothetical protein
MLIMGAFDTYFDWKQMWLQHSCFENLLIKTPLS